MKKFFSTPYDKNYEVKCYPPRDANGYLKNPGDKVRYISRIHVTPVMVAGKSFTNDTPPQYKFYINKTDIDKIQTGTLSEINTSKFESKIINYKLIKSDGTTVSNSVNSHNVNGSFECWKTGALLFLDETSPPTGGKKRRYTRKQRKTRKSNRRVKSYKRRK